MEPGAFIQTEEELERALQYWKNIPFKGSPIKLDDAVSTLNTDSRLVGALHPFAPRWVVCPTICHRRALMLISSLLDALQLVKRDTRQAAIFYTVGIWRWNSHLETGNFVPKGKPVPERLAEDRMYAESTLTRSLQWLLTRAYSQSDPNNLCQISYAFDTFKDKSLWIAQRVSEWSQRFIRNLMAVSFAGL